MIRLALSAFAFGLTACESERPAERDLPPPMQTDVLEVVVPNFGPNIRVNIETGDILDFSFEAPDDVFLPAFLAWSEPHEYFTGSWEEPSDASYAVCSTDNEFISVLRSTKLAEPCRGAFRGFKMEVFTIGSPTMSGVGHCIDQTCRLSVYKTEETDPKIVIGYPFEFLTTLPYVQLQYELSPEGPP